MSEKMIAKKTGGVDYSRKTPISYYGGKQLMLRYILPNIPEHTTYVEPFVGGGAVFGVKKKAFVKYLMTRTRNL